MKLSFQAGDHWEVICNTICVKAGGGVEEPNKLHRESIITSSMQHKVLSEDSLLGL